MEVQRAHKGGASKYRRDAPDRQRGRCRGQLEQVSTDRRFGISTFAVHRFLR